MPAGSQPAAEQPPAARAPTGRPAGEGPAPAQGGAPVPPGHERAGRDHAGQDHGHLSYEEARDQLTEVVRRLESGGLTLEQSLELWERGEQLAAVCADWLEGARARLAAAMPDQEGSADTGAPF